MTVPPARRLPGLINGGETPLENSSVVPDAAPADVPAALKGTTEGARARANSRKLSDTAGEFARGVHGRGLLVPWRPQLAQAPADRRRAGIRQQYPLVPQNELARVGPTTPTRAGRLADASVDPTDARKATVRRFGRSNCARQAWERRMRCN